MLKDTSSKFIGGFLEYKPLLVSKYLIWGFQILTGKSGYINCDGEFEEKGRPMRKEKIQEVQRKNRERYPGAVTHYFICEVRPIEAETSGP